VTDYVLKLEAIETRLREMKGRAEAENPMAAQRGVPELVGWALEMVAQWRRQGRYLVPHDQIRADYLALALGIDDRHHLR
jgi:phage terminase Nu1 subunit (DNA packaging protein)